MPLLFRWHLSYRDQVEYKVYGGTIQRIEVYHATAYHLDYQQAHYNGTIEQFNRDVVRRNGGATVRHRQGASENRWMREEWDAFISFLTLSNKADNEKLAEHRANARPGFEQYYQPVPLVLPRPIYWDFETHQWEDEPFYCIWCDGGHTPIQSSVSDKMVHTGMRTIEDRVVCTRRIK